MTPELLASIAAVLLSLFASYFPGFAAWFEGISPNAKRLLMLALLALTTLGSYVIACADLAAAFKIPATCDPAGAVDLVKAFISAIVANQATYLITPDGRSLSAKSATPKPSPRKPATK
jgi:hypothetical protein